MAEAEGAPCIVFVHLENFSIFAQILLTWKTTINW